MKNHYLDLDEFRASLLKFSLYKHIWTNAYTFFFQNEMVLYLLFSNPFFPPSEIMYYEHFPWKASISVHPKKWQGHWQAAVGCYGRGSWSIQLQGHRAPDHQGGPQPLKHQGPRLASRWPDLYFRG